MIHTGLFTSMPEVSTSLEISGPGFSFWPNFHAGKFPSIFFFFDMFFMRIGWLAAFSYLTGNTDPVVLRLTYLVRPDMPGWCGMVLCSGWIILRL